MLCGMNASIKGKEFISWASLSSPSQKEKSKAVGYIGRNGETDLKIYQKSSGISEISKEAEQAHSHENLIRCLSASLDV